MVISCTLASSGTEAVAAQPAALFLLKGTSFIFSHEFAPLPVNQGVAYLEGKSIRATLGNAKYFKSSVLDYANRPSELESVCWYEFLSEYAVVPVKKKRKTQERKKMSTTDDMEDEKEEREQQHAVSTNNNATRYKFPKEYTKHTSHEVVKLDWPNIPRISGARIPDLEECNNLDDTGNEKRLQYAGYAIAVFAPWRGPADFDFSIQNRWSTWLSLQNKNKITEASLKILANMQGMNTQRMHMNLQKETQKEKKERQKHNIDVHMYTYKSVQKAK